MLQNQLQNQLEKHSYDDGVPAAAGFPKKDRGGSPGKVRRPVIYGQLPMM